MEVIADIPTLRRSLEATSDLAFVPTMGNLHEGHLSLVRLARRHAARVAVSMFVNPLQFGPGEDFSAYPRTMEQDCAMLEREGVDIVFAPSEAQLFPVPQQVVVQPPPIADELCGAFRPGHFRGVATIVLKLLNIVRPRAAVFGKKDYQQLHVVRTMVSQLNVPVEIVAGETQRAPDGLALSSRNGYLSPAQRIEAARLYRNLGRAAQSMRDGNRDFPALGAEVRADLKAHGWDVDYVSVRRRHTLEPAAAADADVVILAAARLGKTRLIDNLEVCLGPAQFAKIWGPVW